MARLVKNHRKPGWKSALNGIVDADGMEKMLAERVFDDGQKYHGQWHHGVMQGSGVYDWTDGEQYRGDWVGDKSHGMGMRRWTNGDRYEGEFKEGKRHGMGVHFYSDGDTFHGEFRNDMAVDGVFTWAIGNKARIKFDDDEKEIVSERITGMDV